MGSKLISERELESAASAPFFADLPYPAVRKLLRAATVQTFPRNKLLFSQGDVADRFYLILEGKVKLFTATESGDETIVEIFEPVRTFAEAAMFATGQFPVNAEVVEPSRLIQVRADTFFQELRENTNLAFLLLATLARRHRVLVRQISELKLKSPGQRLGSFLLSLVDEEKPDCKVQLPFDKVLIASQLGMKPESLSRTLARLRQIGVESHKNEVTIHDIPALRAFCGEVEVAPDRVTE